MHRIPPLATLGPRLMICGPSSNGKSTLALAVTAKTGWPSVHLDQLRHLPDTDWEQRPDEEFAALHDEAIAGETWVMDGNYSKLMPQRLERATGIILLGANRWSNLYRYFLRCMRARDRVGGLVGDRDSVKWSMIHWILVVSPNNLQSYRSRLPQSGLPLIDIGNLHQLNELYAAWKLRRLQ